MRAEIGASPAFQTLKNETEAEGNIVEHPVFEVVCNVFAILMDVLDRFEMSSRPTMHIAFLLH